MKTTLICACLGAALGQDPAPAPADADPSGADAPAADVPAADVSAADVTVEPYVPVIDEAVVETYFTTADYDGNGWISFREARASMSLRRSDYAFYDLDRDGRIVRAEFRDRYEYQVLRTGSFRPPTPPETYETQPRRTPGQLLATYDADRTGSLDRTELARILVEHGMKALPPEFAMKGLDRDLSGRIELGEVGALRDMLIPTTEEVALPFARTPGASVEALFGGNFPREVGVYAMPGPPRIAGPVPPFRRLDLDDDGGISAADLSTLETPLRLGVHPNAVIAALDANGDGKIDRKELLASMGVLGSPKPRR